MKKGEKERKCTGERRKRETGIVYRRKTRETDSVQVRDETERQCTGERRKRETESV